MSASNVCTTSIIVPVRDEPQIGDFLTRLHGVMSSISETYEIIIVMGDKEKLFSEIPSLPNQRIIKTYGDSLERSILNGFSHAKGHRILVCDADDCHPIEKIPKFLESLNIAEMVVASRYILDGKSDLGSFRNFISLYFTKWAHFFGSKLSDPSAGFFAIRKTVLDKVQFKPFTWKTAMEIELKARPLIFEIPITAKKREEGKSKISVKLGIRIAWDVMSNALNSKKTD